MSVSIIAQFCRICHGKLPQTIAGMQEICYAVQQCSTNSLPDGQRKESMKYIRQFLWILLFSFAGEMLKFLIPLPVPASIYGLLLLLAALLTGLLPLESVKEISKFLIEIMPLMFIPAAVGLLESWGALSGIFWQVAAATAVSTVLVMGVSGQVTQYLIRRQGRKQK